MSHTGKLTRGARYWLKRSMDNNLPPGITEDPNKMKDVDYYLAFIKDKDKIEVDKTIWEKHNTSKKPNGRNSLVYFNLKEKLNNWPADTKSKGKK